MSDIAQDDAVEEIEEAKASELDAAPSTDVDGEVAVDAITVLDPVEPKEGVAVDREADATRHDSSDAVSGKARRPLPVVECLRTKRGIRTWRRGS